MDARGILRSGLLLLLLLLPSCGGGGGSGSGGPPAAEIVYVLEKDSSQNGSVQYFAMNPANGSFYNGSNILSTGGTVPVSLVADPSNDDLYVLNNNSSGAFSPGSVTSFSAASYGTTATLISNGVPTGPNPVNMAVDPKGGYLVVADHGDGESASPGDVRVYSLSGGKVTKLGSPWTNGTSGTSGCPNPFRVVFAPGATGATSDEVVVVCSSPELVATRSSTPPIEVYECTLSALTSNQSCGTSVYSNNSTSSPPAITAFAFDPSGKFAAAPQVNGSGSSAGGLLLICSYPFSSSCPTNNPTSKSNQWFTTESVAFFSGSTGEEVYAGNYNPTTYPPSSSNSGGFVNNSNEMAYCFTSSSTPPTLGKSSSSCSILTMTENSQSIGDPYYFFVSGSYLYIVVTGEPLSGPYLTTGPTAASSPKGYLLSCYVGRTSCNVYPTGNGPVSVSTDPQTGHYLFVPTVSGTVSVFSGAGSGSLMPLPSLSLPSGNAALSVVVLTPP